MKRSGRYVEIMDGEFKGEMGIIWNDELPFKGKMKVHVISNGIEFKLTGEKRLIKPDNLRLLGFSK